ncbi:MAG: DUF4058 family protein [Planctomycetota bacterium]
MPSPFPGMDPWLEDPAGWPNVHVQLLAALRSHLQAKVRPRYLVRAEERVYLEDEEAEGDGERRTSRPLVVERRGPAPLPAGPPEPTSRPVLVPTVVVREEKERYLVLTEVGSGDVVAVVELLSPTNERGAGSTGRRTYLSKRNATLASPAHLVEIDLLRGGHRVPMSAPLPPGEYLVIVSDARRRPQCEVYAVGLRERLPTFGIPLSGDERVTVDLQAVFDGVYDDGAFDLAVDYARPPRPPLGGDDAAWAAQRAASRR